MEREDIWEVEWGLGFARLIVSGDSVLYVESLERKGLTIKAGRR